mgnify:CR=1 FL=1
MLARLHRVTRQATPHAVGDRGVRRAPGADLGGHEPRRIGRAPAVGQQAVVGGAPIALIDQEHDSAIVIGADDAAGGLQHAPAEVLAGRSAGIGDAITIGVAPHHDLAPEERDALLKLDVYTLYAMGVHGLLLRPFTIMHKMSDPDYVKALRGE